MGEQKGLLRGLRRPWAPPRLLEPKSVGGVEFYSCETAAALRCETLAPPATPVEVAPGLWAIVTRFKNFDRINGVLERDSGGVRYYCGGGHFIDDTEIAEDVVEQDSYSVWFRPRLLTGFGDRAHREISP